MNRAGARWIEVLLVSQFNLSDQEKYVPDLYIVVVGVAKEGSKARKLFKKRLQEAKASENENMLLELASEVEQDMLDVLPDVIIPKPVLFHDKGVTPQFILDTVERIRKLIRKNSPDIAENRQALSAKYVGKSIDFFNTCWPEKLIDRFVNKTHTWRKLYGAYSFRLFKPYDNINSWLRDVLGHESLATSFSYADVTVVPHVEVKTPDVVAFMSAMTAEMKLLRENCRCGGAESKHESKHEAKHEAKHEGKHEADAADEGEGRGGKSFTLKNGRQKFIENYSLKRKRFANGAEKDAYEQAFIDRVKNDFRQVNMKHVTIADMQSVGLSRDMATKVHKAVKADQQAAQEQVLDDGGDFADDFPEVVMGDDDDEIV